jgi:hypothetical protein
LSREAHDSAATMSARQAITSAMTGDARRNAGGRKVAMSAIEISQDLRRRWGEV